MQRNAIVTGVLILGVGIVLGGLGACRPKSRSLDLFPASVLAELALQKHEAPRGYRLITGTNLLEQAGIASNPDYLTRRGDREDLIQMDGAAAFLALYGPEESVRLVVKGVFFWNPQHAAKYAKVQRTRQRLVTVYQRDTPRGVWLLCVACDPDLTYDATELEQITQGLEAYRRRLALSLLFDQITPDNTE